MEREVWGCENTCAVMCAHTHLDLPEFGWRVNIWWYFVHTAWTKYHKLVAYKWQQFISQSSEIWEVQDQGAGEYLFFINRDFLLRFYMMKRAHKLAWASFIRSLISCIRDSPSWSNQVPKVPPLNTITLGMRFQHRNFGVMQTFRP